MSSDPRLDVRQAFVDLLFPPVCSVCETGLPPRGAIEWGADFCKNCFDSIHDPLAAHCPFCGAYHVVLPSGQDRCARCRGLELHFSQAIALGNYRGALKEQVLRMKRDKLEVLAFQFGRLLGHRLLKLEIEPAERIVPIPSHWWRQLKRGFQASLAIARGIEQVTGWATDARGLKMIRATSKQGTLTIRQRFQNVHCSMVSQRKWAPSSSVLIVDDVMTSGATVGEAARALAQAGLERIRVAVVARGTGQA